MPVKGVIITLGLLFAIFTGCTSYVETVPESGIARPKPKETEEPDNRCDEKEDKRVVTLLVFGGWDDEVDEKKADNEYILEDEKAKMIAALFYNHEMQINDSPVSSAATLAFRIGEDYLNTSMEDLGTLSGRINGKLVTIELSDHEYESVYQIVSRYV